VGEVERREPEKTSVVAVRVLYSGGVHSIGLKWQLFRERSIHERRY